MNLNPLTLLDELLEDWASPKVRRGIHALLLLILFLVTIWLTVGGDWKQALLALGAALYAESNKANTPKVPKYDQEPEGAMPVEVDAATEVPPSLLYPDDGE